MQSRRLNATESTKKNARAINAVTAHPSSPDPYNFFFVIVRRLPRAGHAANCTKYAFEEIT